MTAMKFLGRLLWWKKPKPQRESGRLSQETKRKLLAATIAETSLPGALR